MAHKKISSKFLRFKTIMEIARFLPLQWCYNHLELKKTQDVEMIWTMEISKLEGSFWDSYWNKHVWWFCLVNPNMLSIKVLSFRDRYIPINFDVIRLLCWAALSVLLVGKRCIFLTKYICISLPRWLYFDHKLFY